ncbi:hypothetical protein ACLQ2N_35010 [Streptomyces sp. DT224]|uniref:hypothetical protein n=1 Tax=Streptomyces sp. DT224 TaxID=3393426 RepID=UPI003CE7FDCD
MSYDRFATTADEGVDGDPLRDETTHLILTRKGGDWKVTTDPALEAKAKGPHAYDPAGTYAWADGWRRVTDAG